jgi:muconolactone D-isomerase
MQFHVRMDVHIPHDADPKHIDKLRADEKARAQQLQRDGTWRHLWRIVGEYANISIFDVESSDELHELLTSLPLFPFMQIKVTPLCRHPSAIGPDSDRDHDSVEPQGGYHGREDRTD